MREETLKVADTACTVAVSLDGVMAPMKTGGGGYREPRFTADLNLWVGTEPRNAGAVYEALREFGAPLSGLTADDFAEEGYFYQMGVPPVRVDVLMGIPGVEFDIAWERRVEIDFDGLLVPFISRDDLITAKRASGRPQDMIDVQSLS